MPEPVIPAAGAAAPEVGKPAAGAPTAPAAPQTYTVQVGEKSFELTADQIVSLKGRADQFDITAKQKAELEKGLTALIARIEEDPLALYAARGKDAKKYLTERFRKLVEEEAQDPAARKLAELEQYKADQEKAKADEKAKKDAADAAEKQKVIYQQVLRDLDAAITAEGLPKDYTTIDRMLRVMRSGKTVRGKTFTAAEAAKIVAREETKHLSFWAKSLPSEKLKEMFGPDFIKKLNSEQVKELKKADEQAIKDNKGAANGGDPNDRKKSTLSAAERKAIRNSMPGA